MPLDPSILYRNPPRSLLREIMDGIDSGMAANEQYKAYQDQDQERADKQKQKADAIQFQSTLKTLVNSNDAKTPEGRQSILQGLVSMGKFPEAHTVAQTFDALYPKPTQEEYDYKDGLDANGKPAMFALPKHDPTKAAAVPGMTPKAAPTKRDLKPNKQGFYTSIDQDTGLDTNGKPVEAPPPQATPWSPVVTTNSDGTQKTVFVDPRNPRAPAIDPNLPKTVGVNGETAIPGLEPLPGVQITKDSIKSVKAGAQAYDEVKRQLQGLRELYAKTGTEMGGEKARRLASKVRQLQLTLKGPEFLQLGVLTGPDMSLLDEMVPNPTSLSDNLKSMIPGMGDPVTPKLDELDNFIEGRFNSALQRNGFKRAAQTPPPGAGAAHPQDSEAVQWAKSHPNDPRSAAILKANGVQ